MWMMKVILRFFFVLPLSMLFVGCAVKPTMQVSDDILEQAWQERLNKLADISTWKLKGRVAINHVEDSWTASLNWQESEDDQEVRVIAPLGQGTAILKRLENGLSELRLSNGEVYSGGTASELLQQQLGWRLPVESLVHWVKGAPDPRYSSTWKLNQEGGASVIEQAGWQVEYRKYRFSELYNVDLPAKMFLKKGGWQVKLVVRSWQGV